MLSLESIPEVCHRKQFEILSQESLPRPMGSRFAGYLWGRSCIYILGGFGALAVLPRTINSGWTTISFG